MQRLLLSALLIMLLALGNLHPASLAHDDHDHGSAESNHLALPESDDHDAPADQAQASDHHVIAVAQRASAAATRTAVERDSFELPPREAPLVAWRAIPLTEPPSA